MNGALDTWTGGNRYAKAVNMVNIKKEINMVQKRCHIHLGAL